MQKLKVRRWIKFVAALIAQRFGVKLGVTAVGRLVIGRAGSRG